MPTEIDEDVIEAEIDTDEDDEGDDDIDDIDVNAVTAVNADIDDDEEEEEEEEVVVAEDVEMEVDDENVEKDGDEDDDEEVLAAVVVADDDDDDDDQGDVDINSVAVESAAVVATVAETPKRRASTPAKSSTSPKRKPASHANKQPPANAPSKQHGTTNATKKVVNNNKKRPNSGTANGEAKATVVKQVDEIMKSLPAKKVVAARDARAMLRDTASSLPLSIADIQVRSFGQLCIQSMPVIASSKPSPPNPQLALLSNHPFHTATTLYPVGFSCDRYELSPVHGRILKMRCTILDGRSIKANQKSGGFPVQNDLPDGPVFRIMWGRGVDDDSITTTMPAVNSKTNNMKVEYTFDPYTQSKPIVSTGSTKNDALIVDAIKSTKRLTIAPKVGMRVKVLCDKDIYFPGTITTVNESKPVMTNGKKKRKRYQVKIHYDDGITEEMTFPDPDIELLIPGISLDLFFFVSKTDSLTAKIV